MKDLYVKLIFGVMVVTAVIILWSSFDSEAPVLSPEPEIIKKEPKKKSVATPPKTESKAKSKQILSDKKPEEPLDQNSEPADYYSMGLEAVRNVEGVFIAEIGFLFQDDSENAKLLKQGQYRELFINALAKPESPDSHFYMAMIDFRCSSVDTSSGSSVPPDYEDLTKSKYENIDQDQRLLYEGYNAGLLQSHQKVNTECVEVNLLKENNHAFIQNSLQQTFGKKSFMDLISSVLENEDSAKAFFEKTSIKPTPALEKAISIETALKTKQDDLVEAAYKDLVESSINNPDLYLAEKKCMYRSQCKKLVGEERHLEYLKTGARFGSRGTIRKYLKELVKASKEDEALAWAKYNQALIRKGCSTNSLIYNDYKLTKDIKKFESELTEEQISKSQLFYEQIKSEYFDSAARKLGCSS